MWQIGPVSGRTFGRVANKVGQRSGCLCEGLNKLQRKHFTAALTRAQTERKQHAPSATAVAMSPTFVPVKADQSHDQSKSLQSRSGGEQWPFDAGTQQRRWRRIHQPQFTSTSGPTADPDPSTTTFTRDYEPSKEKLTGSVGNGAVCQDQVAHSTQECGHWLMLPGQLTKTPQEVSSGLQQSSMSMLISKASSGM